MADKINFDSLFTSNEDKRIFVADLFDERKFNNEEFKNDENYAKYRDFLLEQIADGKLYADEKDPAVLESITALTIEAAEEKRTDNQKHLESAAAAVKDLRNLEREQKIELVLNHLNQYGEFAANNKYGDLTISEADFRSVLQEQRDYLAKRNQPAPRFLATGTVAPGNDLEILNDRVYSAWPKLAEEEIKTSIEADSSRDAELENELSLLRGSLSRSEAQKNELMAGKEQSINAELAPLQNRITLDGRLQYAEERLAADPENRALESEVEFLRGFQQALKAEKAMADSGATYIADRNNSAILLSNGKEADGSDLSEERKQELTDRIENINKLNQLAHSVPEMRKTFLSYTAEDSAKIEKLKDQKKNIEKQPEIAAISADIANLEKQIKSKENEQNKIKTSSNAAKSRLNDYLADGQKKEKLQDSLQELENALKVKQSTKLFSRDMFKNLGARSQTFGSSYDSKVKDLAKLMKISELEQWLPKEGQESGYQAEKNAIETMKRRSPREKNAYEQAKKRLETKKKIFEEQKKSLEQKAKDNAAKLDERYKPLKDKAKAQVKEKMEKVFFDEKQMKIIEDLKKRDGNKRKNLESLVKAYIQKAITPDGEFISKLKNELGMSQDEIDRFIGLAQELNGIETPKGKQAEEDKTKEEQSKKEKEEQNKTVILNNEEHHAETNYEDKPWVKVSEKTFYKEETNSETGLRNVTVTSKDGIPSVEDFQELLKNYKDNPIQIGKGEDQFKLNLMEAAVRSDIAINTEGMSEEDKKLLEQAKAKAKEEKSDEAKPIVLEQNIEEKTEERTDNQPKKDIQKKHKLTEKQKETLESAGLSSNEIFWEKLDEKAKECLNNGNFGEGYLNSAVYQADRRNDVETKAGQRLFKDMNIDITENNAAHKLEVMKSVSEMSAEEFEKFSELDPKGNPKGAVWGSLTDDERKLLTDLNKVSNAKDSEIKGGDRQRAQRLGRLVGQYKETVERNNTAETKRKFYNTNVKPHVRPKGNDGR